MSSIQQASFRPSSAPRVRLLAAAGSLTLAATLAGVGAAPTQAAVDAPKPTEAFAPYLPQVSCDPVAKRGVVKFRDLVLERFGGRDLGIVRSCATGGLSEHKEGRALDWGLNWYDPKEREIAQRAIHWLLKAGPRDGKHATKARRFGIMYMIWNGRIWGSYRASEGWRDYTGSSAHRDHMHLSFSWNGAQARNTWWRQRLFRVDYGPCPDRPGQLAEPWREPNHEPCSNYRTGGRTGLPNPTDY